MSADASQTVAAGLLRSFIERIERVEADIKERNADKSEIYKELRGQGFNVKAVRQCVAARKLDSAEREERDAIFDLYWEALTGASRVRVHEEQPNSSSLTSSPAKTKKAGAARTPAPANNSASSEPNPTPVARTSEPEAEPLTASGNTENPDPLLSKADGGQPQSSDTGGAKGDGTHTVVGQGGEEPGTTNAKSEQQDASASQGRNEPASESGATATIPDADMPLFLLKDRAQLRPNCLNPSNCAGYGTKHCHSCLTTAEQQGRAA